jgi:hypothetical protein
MKNWKQSTIVTIIAFFGIIVGFTACPPDNNNGTTDPVCTCPNGTVHTDEACGCNAIGYDCNCTYEPLDIRKPTANADVNGGSNTITPPEYPTPTSVTLNGSGTGYDNEIVTLTWTIKSTPDGVLGTPTPIGLGTIVTVDNLKKAGQYIFVLSVERENGVKNTDEVIITVETWEVAKTVAVNFPNLIYGTKNLNFSPNYSPAIAGGGFENDDIVYYVTNNQTSVKADSLNDYEIGGFSPGPIDFIQIFEYIDGKEIARQTISTSVNISGTFISVNVPTDPISLALEKKVTEVP